MRRSQREKDSGSSQGRRWCRPLAVAIIAAFMGSVLVLPGRIAVGTAHADFTSMQAFTVSQTCTEQPLGQLCTPPWTTTIQTGQYLSINYTNTNCSVMRLHIFVDNVEQISISPTNWIPIGASTGNITVGPVTPGSHTLGLESEGYTNGCNPGYINNWIGNLTVTPDASGTIIPYGAAGWAYCDASCQQGSSTTGWSDASFNDSAWPTGSAPFSDEGSTGCGYAPATNWPLNTSMLVRKHFTLPTDAANLQVSVAIDNDVQVWINGHDISNGLQTHEGCATYPTFVFPSATTYVPVSDLNAGGDNVIAVQGVDRGSVDLLDVQVAAATTSLPAPNPPQNVANFQGQGARQIYVTWQAPQPNGAQIDHYNIVEIHADGTPGVVVDSVSATTLSDTISSTASLSINPCEYYRFGVVAVGSDGQQSTLASPSAPAFSYGYPDAPPKTVAVLVQGLNSSLDGDGGSPFNPLQFGYCTSFDGINPVPVSYRLPAALQSLFAAWMNADNPKIMPPFGAGNNMIDSLAGTGAVVLPFSYKGATLSGAATAPSFQANDYIGSDVGKTLPDDGARILNAEINSIQKVWPNARIVVVGHSNGGLIAEHWWSTLGAAAATSGTTHVVQAFSLDSPLNGVLDESCVALPNICSLFGFGPALSATYPVYWKNKDVWDPRVYAPLDDKTNLFTAIGTPGDPLYDFADAPQNGLLSQLFYSPTNTMLGHSFLCPAQNDGGPPLFGLRPWPLSNDLYIHSIAKNCGVAINKVMSYVQP